MMKSKRPLNEVIKQRRTQMLIHSYLYYHEDTTLVSDDTWQRWANELRDLQEANPKESKIDFFDKEFDGGLEIQVFIFHSINGLYQKQDILQVLQVSMNKYISIVIQCNPM